MVNLILEFFSAVPCKSDSALLHPGGIAECKHLEKSNADHMKNVITGGVNGENSIRVGYIDHVSQSFSFPNMAAPVTYFDVLTIV